MFGQLSRAIRERTRTMTSQNRQPNPPPRKQAPCGGRYRSTRRFGPGFVKMVGSAACFLECVHSGMPPRSDATGKTQRLPTILPERLTLGTAYRHPMSSGSIQGPGRQLARGCLVGNAEVWQRGGPRHGPHLPCGRCMPWATVSWIGVQALELDHGS